MKASVDILRGEMERLFSNTGLKELCVEMLDVDPQAEGLHDDSKAVYVRRLMEWCTERDAVEALADAVMALKKGMVDPRVKQVFLARFDRETGETAIPGYRLKGEIASDSIGARYACEPLEGGDGEPDLEAWVVHGEHAVDGAAVQRFLMSMRSLARAAPDSASKVEAVGTLEDGRPYVVGPRAEGEPLADMLPLTVLEALDVFGAVLDALEEVHGKGVVHTDLRPRNVLVRKAGEGEEPVTEVALLGFGADKLFYGGRPEGSDVLFGLGNVRSMAPELARGSAPDPRADFYSLGALLGEMVTGKPMFTGRSAADILAAHLTQAPPDPSAVVEEAVPGALDKLVKRLMSREPAQRPRDLDDIRKSLGEVKRAAEEIAARAAQTGTREDIETWADALVESPEDEEILAELTNEARRCNAWGAAVEVLEEAALTAEEPGVVRRLLLAAADAAARYLKDYEKAGQLYEQLVESHPGDEEIESAVRRLLRAEGKFEALVEKLIARAEASEDAGEKLRIAREIGEIYELDIKDPAKAFDYFLACLGSDSVDEDLLGRLEKLAERMERFQDLATACGTAVQGAESAGAEDATVSYYRRIGMWYLERLDQPNYALTCFQKVLEYCPGDTEALEAVADLYRGAQQWSELAQVMERLGEVEPIPERSRDRLTNAARIHYERLSDVDKARKILEDVVTEDRAHVEAGKLLSKIHEEAEEWGKVAELRSARIDAMPEGEEQVSARYELGELYEDRLDDLKAAKEQYRKALEIDPRHLDAVKGLERICARTGDTAGLRDNLETQAEIAVTPRQRMLLFERLSELYEEEFHDNEKAIEYHGKVLDIDDDHASSLIALTRLYRRTERFEDLVDILHKRAELAETEDEKRDLLKERASVIKENIGDPQRAAEAFQAVASLGVDDALETLANTQEEAGDFAAAVETVKRMIDAADENEGKVALLLRKAALERDRLDDASEAAATLRRAKDLAGDDRSVLAALKDTYIAQKNFSAAMDVLSEELELVEGTHSRAEIYAQMGLIAADDMGDTDRAISMFEHALDLDESNLTAGDRGSEIYRKRDQWDKALPIYERWAGSVEALDSEKRIELYTQLGEAYSHLDRGDDALEAFRKASDLAHDDPPLMKRLGEVALSLGEHDISREQFSRYLEIASDGMSAEEKVDILVKLGSACLGAEDVSEAAKLARQSTVMFPDHGEARLLLARVNESRGDYRGAVESYQRVLSGMEEKGDEWRALMRKTAGIMFESLRDADGAASVLKDVHETFPEDRDVLGDLLKIYNATKRFGDIVEVILLIADLVEDPQQLARYYLTVAKIYRRELKQTDDAVAYFEMAIEQDPTMSDAEDALVEILTEGKDWEKLEKYYKKSIARLPKDATAEEKIDLYVPLADIVANKLGREKDGIMLTEAISKLAPDDLSWQEKLADLYGWKTEHASKSVAVHQRLLDSNPARVDSFRMLYRIHSAEENPDQTWCAASMLAMLNQASPEEHQYYRDSKPEDPPTMKSPLNDEQWSRILCHRDMNQSITDIFSVASKAIARKKARKLSEFGLERGDAIDAKDDSSQFAGLLGFAAGTLSVDMPELYFHEGQGSGFQLLDTDPPAIVVGETAASLKDRMGLAYSLGQQLSLLRPGFFVKKLVTSGTELSSWLLASIKVFVPSLPVPGDLAGKVQERLSPLREALDATEMERLQGYVQAFVSKAADVNLKRWARAAEYTMDRAGLLLCGDVAVAVRVLKEQIDDKKELSRRLRELTLFTVSAEHHKLRAHLGTALEAG